MTPNASAQGPICIIGMHRSGTSMVARLLYRCGLELGPSDQLRGPSEHNSLGHFESEQVIAINEALLAHCGGSWDHPPALMPGWERDPAIASLVREAAAFVDSFPRHVPWGWKEPRTTVLLPFWRSVVPRLRFVICIRNPLDVAKSLAARDGMSVEHAASLWDRYTRAAIRDTEGSDRLVIFYEDVLTYAAFEAARLVNFCHLPAPGAMTEVQGAVVPEIAHHRSDTAELLDEEPALTEPKLVYLGLRALLLESRRVDPSEKAEAGLSQRMSGLLRLCEHFRDTHDAAKLESLLAESRQQVFRAQTTLKAVQTTLTAVQDALAKKEQHAADLHALAQAQQRELETIYRTIGWRCVTACWGVINRLIPPGTRRRRWYESALKRLKQ